MGVKSGTKYVLGWFCSSRYFTHKPWAEQQEALWLINSVSAKVTFCTESILIAKPLKITLLQAEKGWKKN